MDAVGVGCALDTISSIGIQGESAPFFLFGGFDD
jgi:hypothetical protein